MAEYIKREDAQEILEMALDDDWEIGYATDRLNDIPAADVRPVVKGEWIWDDEGYHCSECFYHAYGETAEVLSGHWNFCPNCGADMTPPKEG